MKHGTCHPPQGMLSVVPGSADEERGARIAAARRDEREAAARLQSLLRQAEEGLADAGRRLARLDGTLEAIRGTLRRGGYLA